MGLRVPEDVSIAGYDGIAIGQCIRPRLTTIHQDTTVMGAEAARLLISRVEDAAFPISTVQVPVSLLPGESLGRVPAAFA